MDKFIRRARKNNLIQGELFDSATINYFQIYVVDVLETGIHYIYFESPNKPDTFLMEWKNIKNAFYKKNKIGCCYYFTYFHDNTLKDVYIRFVWFCKKKTLLHSNILSLIKKNIDVQTLKSKEKMINFMLNHK